MTVVPPRRRRCSTRLAAVGIDFEDVLLALEKEGVDKFKKSWTELVETVLARWRRPGRPRHERDGLTP